MAGSIGGSRGGAKTMDSGNVQVPVELSEAERQAEDHLRTCKALEHAITNAAEVLVGAGVSLQMNFSLQEESMCSLNKALVSEAPPLARACRNLVEVCSTLGADLVGLACSLSGDFLAPLRDLQTTIEAERAREKEKMDKLELDEAKSTAALLESAQKKARASAGLQELARERAAIEAGGAAGAAAAMGAGGRAALKWLRMPTLFQPTETCESRLQQELATRSDEALAARLRRERGADDMRCFLAQLAAKSREVMEKSLARCATAWGRTSASFARAEDSLNDSVAELADWGIVSDISAASTSASSWTREEQAAFAAQARKLVPKLNFEKVGGGPGGRIAPKSAHGSSRSSSSFASSEGSVGSVRSPTGSVHLPSCDNNGSMCRLGDTGIDSCGDLDPPLAPVAAHPTAAQVSLPGGAPPSLLQLPRQASLLVTCKGGPGSLSGSLTGSSAVHQSKTVIKAGLSPTNAPSLVGLPVASDPIEVGPELFPEAGILRVSPTNTKKKVKPTALL
eukprot:TRINITY_DN15794_c0_g1_i3.p1 TRINITY_DN15794_c0_g1~~TRINITY_DN15794_c0_g1_i3.p1  ORF type:complete len:566 (-),score=121.84 TRINITY_DN15794_c0_g1_i3:116-1645(-)